MATSSVLEPSTTGKLVKLFPVTVALKSGVAIILHGDGTWSGDRQKWLDTVASLPADAPDGKVRDWQTLWLVTNAIRNLDAQRMEG